jgi:hypothetical protein
MDEWMVPLNLHWVKYKADAKDSKFCFQKSPLICCCHAPLELEASSLQNLNCLRKTRAANTDMVESHLEHLGIP